jgi:hypothetical protein
VGLLAPISIVGGTLLAGVFAIAHHVFDTRLNGHPASGFWSQINAGRMEIFLATGFKILFCFTAGISICQLVCASLFYVAAR